jgi:hypothetical protein
MERGKAMVSGGLDIGEEIVVQDALEFREVA